MLSQSVFIILVLILYLTFMTVVLNLKARTLVLLDIFFLFFLPACSLRTLETEGGGELGNLALICFSVVLG